MSKNRKDAKRIKTHGMLRLLTYLKDRQDADVYINKKIDVTELIKYVEKKKKKNPELTYFHVFSTACAKVIYNRPKLNSFVVNHEFYQRNDVSIAFVAKVDFSDHSKEFLSLIKIDPEDNIDTIKNKIRAKVEKVRSNTQNSTDNSIDILDKLPRWLLTFLVAPIAKWMDRHDLLPKSFNEDLIYNSSIILSNLGSIRCGAIYHNLTNFGTNSILMTIGDIHKEPVVNEKGEIVVRDVVEFGINLDERIADGVYFSKAVNMLEYILKNPELLEGRVDEEIKEKENFKY